MTAPALDLLADRDLTALDLFAGVGWALAAHALGMRERGVENATAVLETRSRLRLVTTYRDVWDGLFGVYGVGRYDVLIASPPCQTFSAAGKGAGRLALEQVLAAIAAGLYRDVVALHRLTEELDPRTALVLTPLAHVYRDSPTYVVLEQVPPVLPVWEAYAVVMRALGYSVVTGILNAEQYGVPQTRRRAFLIARRDGVPAAMPAPTHSAYYPRNPRKLDLGVEKWVSMGDALGWSRDDLLFAGAGATASVTSGQRQRPMDEPAHTVTGMGTATFVLRSNYGTSGDPEARGERTLEQPAPTMTSKAGRNLWVFDRPATTVAGDPRVWPPGHKVNAADIARDPDAREKYGDRAGTDALRLTEDQAAVLQTFPEGLPWAGTKGDRFLQIGNAVPPLLGQHVLAAAVAQ